MSYSPQLKSQGSADDLNENSPLISFLHPSKKLKAKLQTARQAGSQSSRSTSMTAGSQSVGRKRTRLILSDEECELDGEHNPSRGVYECHIEEVATSNGCE